VDLPIVVPGRRPIRPDIVFTRRRIAVFIDGCFWHGCPEHGSQPQANAEYWGSKLRRNHERDEEADRLLAEAGWKVLRIWEHVAVREAESLVLRSVGQLSRGDRSPDGRARD
jgi:DNA mismatch endonuclease (patch repair protein)